MADIVNQHTGSAYALIPNKLTATPNQASWGFPDTTGPNALDPLISRLHRTYSVDGIPVVRIVDFNRAALNGSTTAGLNVPSRIDELDLRAPNLTPRGVVSQVYKSPRGRQYRDLGPRSGRY